MSPTGGPSRPTPLLPGGEHLTAVLLAGHSNSGKTPLGRRVEHDLSEPGRRFVHFDFGHCLRGVAGGNPVAKLSPEEIAYVHSVMNGRLMDDQHFGIARKLLAGFLRHTSFNAHTDTLLLNGLPRHTGQARDLETAGVRVAMLILLRCDPETALRRMSLAARGRGHENRGDRHDNTLPILRRKCESFNRDTMPMVEHYRKRDVPIVTIEVTPEMTPGEMLGRVEAELEWPEGGGRRAESRRQKAEGRRAVV